MTVPPPTGTVEVAARAADVPAEPEELEEAAEPADGDDAADDASELDDAPEPGLVLPAGVPAAALLLLEDEQPAQTAPTATAIPNTARRRVGSWRAGQADSSWASA